jgi:hypothetical protein
MNKWKEYSKMLFLVLLMVVFVGCSKKDNNPIGPDITGTITTNLTVPSTSLADNSTGIAINTAITATFDEAMDISTITTANFSVTAGGTPITGTVTGVGTTVIFTPAGNLAASTLYTATITTGVKSLSGNALASNYVWSFTTGTTADTTQSTVTTTLPADTTTDMPIGNTLTATFSEAMDPLTITTTTFTLMQGTTAVSGSVTYSGVTANFTPTSKLATGTLYTATITTGVKDLAGNALASNYVWSFTTSTTLTAGPAPVNLGMAENYVILAKSAISTTGTTAITGNLGLSPAAATFITGFSLIADATNVFSRSSRVTGMIYAANYANPTPANLTTAVLNMMTAYTDAAGRAPNVTELGAGNIGGMTLTPGTYKWSTGVLIPTNVTLSGGPNDVWIFQIAKNLVMSSATRVILSGGAQAKNIFWQVFGIVDIGTTAHFEGIALVQTAVTLKTGATVNGRLLAQTAVTLDAATVTQPAP